MRLKEIKLLGIKVTTNSKKEILEYVRKYLAKSQKSSASWRIKSQKLEGKPLVIVTPNPEQVVLAQKDTDFAKILNQADVAIPDGIGISLASRFLNAKCQMPNAKWKLQRIAGIEFMVDLVEIAQKEGYRIGLIGGRDGVAVKALECLMKKYPGLQGWTEEGPEVDVTENGVRIRYYGSTNKPLSRSIHHNTSPIIHSLDNTEDYFQKIAHRIKESDTQIVFVGFGAPKQEYFLEAVSCQLSAVSCVLMSVGGSFDILAGRVARAPFVMRHVGLEWLWRLFKEPWRFRRQLALVKFIWFVLCEKRDTYV